MASLTPLTSTINSRLLYNLLGMSDGEPCISFQNGDPAHPDSDDVLIVSITNSDDWKKTGFIPDLVKAIVPDDRMRFCHAVLKAAPKAHALYFMVALLSSDPAPADVKEEIARVVQKWYEVRPDITEKYGSLMANLAILASPIVHDLAAMAFQNPELLREVEKGNIGTDRLCAALTAWFKSPSNNASLLRFMDELSDEKWDTLPSMARTLLTCGVFTGRTKEEDTEESGKKAIQGVLGTGDRYAARAQSVFDALAAGALPDNDVELLRNSFDSVYLYYAGIRNKHMPIAALPQDPLRAGLSPTHLELLPVEQREKEWTFYHRACVLSGLTPIYGMPEVLKTAIPLLDKTMTSSGILEEMEEMRYNAYAPMFCVRAVKAAFMAQTEKFDPNGEWTKCYRQILERATWDSPDEHGMLDIHDKEMRDVAGFRAVVAACSSPVLKSWMGAVFLGHVTATLFPCDEQQMLESQGISMEVERNISHRFPPAAFWRDMIARHYGHENEDLKAFDTKIGTGTPLRILSDYMAKNCYSNLLQHCDIRITGAKLDESSVRSFWGLGVMALGAAAGARYKTKQWTQAAVGTLPNFCREDFVHFKKNYKDIFDYENDSSGSTPSRPYDGDSWRILLGKFRSRHPAKNVAGTGRQPEPAIKPSRCAPVFDEIDFHPF